MCPCPCPCPSVSSTCITVTQLPAGDRAQYGGGQYRLLTGGRLVSKQGCAKCRKLRCVLLCPAIVETPGRSKTGTCERSVTCQRRFHSKHLYMAKNHISLGLSCLVSTSFQNKQETFYQPGGVRMGKKNVIFPILRTSSSSNSSYKLDKSERRPTVQQVS